MFTAAFGGIREHALTGKIGLTSPSKCGNRTEQSPIDADRAYTPNDNVISATRFVIVVLCHNLLARVARALASDE